MIDAVGGLLMVYPAMMVHPVMDGNDLRTPLPQPRVVPVETAVRSAVNLATVNAASIHMLNPQVIGFVPIPLGQPRGAFSLPTLISPTISPAEQTLFEEPRDPAKKHYLPRYDLATIQGASRLLKSVVLRPSQNACELVVNLTEVTTPASSAGNIRQDAAARYFLTGTYQGAAMSWDLTVRSSAPNAIQLVLSLPRPGDVGNLYYVMTEPAAQAKLVIRRTLGVALPLPPAPPPPPAPPVHPPVPPVGRPPIGPVMVAAPSPARPLLFPMPRLLPPPAAPPQPLYRVATVTIDLSIPFTFSKELDRNVFEQLEGPPSAPAGFIKRDLVWSKNDKGDGNSYSYYLDGYYQQYGTQPCPFYFFPDTFKIGRQSAPPHAPELTVNTSGQDVNSVTLTRPSGVGSPADCSRGPAVERYVRAQCSAGGERISWK
jgi:hypothetical protein